MSHHDKSSIIVRYERTHCVTPVRIKKEWVNGTFRATRVTEVPWNKMEKPDSARMSSGELDNWGSCMSVEDRNVDPTLVKSFMEFRGLLGKPGTWLGSGLPGETPSHDKYLPLDDNAWDSHARDVERVSRGEAPTQPSGWIEDPLTSTDDDLTLAGEKYEQPSR